MAYTIDKISTDADSVIAHITIALDNGEPLEITVPAYRPKTEVEVLEIIAAREAYEVQKANIAPVLADIRTKLEARVGVKLVAAAVVAEAKAAKG